jgi:NhaP-type Na+/H+ or K+/H+ antiporter
VALFKLVALLAAGVAISKLLHIEDLSTHEWYQMVTSALLAVALYASTYGINRTMAKRHVKLIVTAVTVGVIVKAAIIAGLMSPVFGTIFCVLGIVVSQIDPLSVARLMRKGSPMSERAQTILGAWSSFDDPMTVLLALYVPTFIVAPTPGAEPIAEGGWMGYVIGLGFNLLFAALVWALWRYSRLRLSNVMLVLVIGYALLAFSFATAVMCLMMLGLALIGLFLRPTRSQAKASPDAETEEDDEPERFDRFLGRAVDVCYMAAAVLLGIMLAEGVNPVAGIAMGIVAYFVQAVVAVPLTRKLGRSDRIYLMFAQQLGITAIILSLRFEPSYPGTVAIVAPAIIVCNLLHAVCNKWLVPHLIARKA